ncbi:1-acyl-sn-glycerol-3-phosphate acyltransferase [Streptomyces canus]
MFYYLLKYVLLGPLLRLVFRPRIEGLEHIPESGAAIVAGNHLSFSDHFLMPAVLKRRITFLAKAEYFTGPGIKGRLTAFFFRSAGQIPVDRSGKEAGQAAIREGLGVLRKDELLGIYPEGTRSHDGRLYKGKVGVAVMALKAQAPVIPCAMIGTFEAQPPRQGHPPSAPRGDPLRQASGLLPLRRDGEREGDPAGHHRRDHVRHPHALRAGVRRPVRGGGEGGGGRRGEGTQVPAAAAELSSAVGRTPWSRRG